MKFLKRPRRMVFTYLVTGEPIPLAKVTETPGPTQWNEYKASRFNYIQTIKNQHDAYFKKCTFEEGAINRRQFVDGPIKLEATFYMKATPTKKAPQPHTTAPPTFSLFNFLDHALQGVIYKKDCTIASVELNKIYDEVPRTEITITRLRKPARRVRKNAKSSKEKE